MASPGTTRTAVLAAAAVVALLALVGGGALLLGVVGGDDELASPAPTAVPSPSPSPSASPSPSPSPSPAAAPEPATWELDAALVTPEAASAAEEPGWLVDEAEGEPGPLLDPCGDGDFPLADAIAASDERLLSSEREAGGSNLAQEVFRYATEQDAAAAFRGYLERIERCPTAPVPDVPEHEVERSVVAEASGQDRLLMKERYCDPTCSDLFTTYAMVVRTADGLSVLTYAIGEDGDPADGAAALLDVAAEALQTAVTG